MSDKAMADEMARLYEKAVEYGMIPKDWDGEPPAPPPPREQHRTHDRERDRK